MTRYTGETKAFCTPENLKILDDFINDRDAVSIKFPGQKQNLINAMAVRRSGHKTAKDAGLGTMSIDGGTVLIRKKWVPPIIVDDIETLRLAATRVVNLLLTPNMAYSPDEAANIFPAVATAEQMRAVRVLAELLDRLN